MVQPPFWWHYCDFASTVNLMQAMYVYQFIHISTDTWSYNYILVYCVCVCVCVCVCTCDSHVKTFFPFEFFFKFLYTELYLKSGQFAPITLSRKIKQIAKVLVFYITLSTVAQLTLYTVHLYIGVCVHVHGCACAL